jgi:hypothetical protein
LSPSRSVSDAITFCNRGTSADPTTNCMGCQIKMGNVYMLTLLLFSKIAIMRGMPNAMFFCVHPNKPMTRNFGSSRMSSFNKYQANALQDTMHRKMNKITTTMDPKAIFGALL